MNMTDVNSTASVNMTGSFLREVQRLIDSSDRTATEVAAAAELPVAALSGAHRGIIRIPGTKLKQLACELELPHDALLRVWLQEFQPWPVELLDELTRGGCLEPARSSALSSAMVR